MTTTTKIFIGAMVVATAITFWASLKGWGVTTPRLEKKSLRHGSVSRSHHRSHSHYLGK